jgi:4-amino-4-deoxy-L-arabinose transferase-like glycosyltransferase
MLDTTIPAAAGGRVDGARAGARVVLLLLALAAFLRFYGIRHGMPFAYDPDEPFLVARAMRIVLTGDLNPHWFGHPASVVIYASAAYYKLLQWWGTGWLGLSSVRDYFVQNPAPFYVGPRVLSALAGVGTVGMVHAIAQRLYGPRAAWLAAFLVAVNALHVEFSQLVRSDVIATFFLMLVAWQALGIVQTRAPRHYAGACAFLAMATATKYPAVVGGLMILLAHVLSDRTRIWREWWKLAIAGLAFVVVLFLCSPYMFLDPAAVIQGLRDETRVTHLSAEGEGLLKNLGWYVGYVLPDKFGIVPLLLALVFALAGARRLPAGLPRQGHAIVACFVVVFLLFLSTLTLRWARWVIPVVPFLAMLAAAGADRLLAWAACRGALASRAAVGATLLLLVAWPAYQAGMQAWARKYDTRTHAQRWILEHIPRGSTILVEIYGPQLPVGAYRQFSTQLRTLTPEPTPPGRPYAVPRSQFGPYATVEQLRQAGIEYVVLTNVRSRYEAQADRHADVLARYDELLWQARVIKRFVPRCYDPDRDPTLRSAIGGPEIRVLQLEPFASTRPMPEDTATAGSMWPCG